MSKNSFILKTVLFCLILSSVVLSGAATAEDVRPPAKGIVQNSQVRVVP